MDRLKSYRAIVKQFLQERADLMNSQPVPGLETLCIFDEERDEYLILNIGWRDGRRIQYITVLIRIQNGKIWVDEDGTEEGMANILVAAGVPKEDIVLAFNPPEMRHLSEYAIA